MKKLRVQVDASSIQVRRCPPVSVGLDFIFVLGMMGYLDALHHVQEQSNSSYHHSANHSTLPLALRPSISAPPPELVAVYEAQVACSGKENWKGAPETVCTSLFRAHSRPLKARYSRVKTAYICGLRHALRDNIDRKGPGIDAPNLKASTFAAVRVRRSVLTPLLSQVPIEAQEDSETLFIVTQRSPEISLADPIPKLWTFADRQRMPRFRSLGILLEDVTLVDADSRSQPSHRIP
ncbi:hypothetical protein NMY22_g18593 [Coprinellus aureogranulatus]|nr:hypothetical protein NMY22_g18593 [Coprinellus aureogranulatus]